MNNPFIQPGQFTDEELPFASKIQQRRLQMLVHSCIYYELDQNIIPDRQFDEWARELVKLQKDHPEIASRVCYAEAFADWDASTGAFLPLTDPWVMAKALTFVRPNKKGRKHEHKEIQQEPREQCSQKPQGKKATKFGGNPLF